MRDRSEVLLIGGRSGVGKTTVAAEVHTQLARADVRHCLVEGDNLDLAHPVPWLQGHELAEANLAAIWRNYKEVGYTRLVYVNTAVVLPAVMESIIGAMGDQPRVRAVLLTGSDAVVDARLAAREVGSGAGDHARRSRAAAARLAAEAPDWVVRIDTDGRSVIDVVAQVLRHVGWTRPHT